ncbi:hypothetical protein JCM15519_20810 [Fundidesulfovibrio butyratiphilus]
MLQPLRTRASVPADGRFLAILQGHVRELAVIAGFSSKDATALELATEEAFLNILQHAFPDGSPGEVFLEGNILETELWLTFRDEGMPFDPSLLHVPDPAADADAAGSGLGLKLIRYAVDEVHWVNCGRQGKELRLIKRLPQAVDAVASAETEKVQQADPQPYDIRPMRPDEALQVARIFWLAYGYSYKNDNFYRPEGLLHLVGSGRLISYVAVTRKGEVVGHAGLLRSEPLAMAEAALLVVSPSHRGRGLMNALTDALTAKARELALFGLSLNPVTSHPASQREVIQIGGRPCGLDLAACPPRRFKGMHLDQIVPQRESYLHCFQYLMPPPKAVAHVPSRHRDMVGSIYDQLQRPLTLGPLGPASLPGDYRVSFDRELQKGVIRVVRAYARQWPEILRAAVDLVEIAGAAVVDLDLPLAQPATALVCEQAEAAGFFFAGVWPHEAADGDVLRLTRLAAPLDLDRLRFSAPFSREVAAYVGKEMERASRTTGVGDATP